MSGIYLHGMKMPKNCDECWTKFHGFGWVEHDEEWGTFYCKAGKGFCSDPRTKCPLLPVPDHGDLIDRKPFVEFIKTHWDGYDQWFADQLEARPTIIPADRGDAE